MRDLQVFIHFHDIKVLQRLGRVCQHSYIFCERIFHFNLIILTQTSDFSYP